MPALAHCPALQTLHVEDIDSEDLAALSSLKDLSTLTFSGVCKNLSSLSMLTALRSLELLHPAPSLVGLQLCKSLTRLSVQHARLDESEFPVVLPLCPKLRALRIPSRRGSLSWLAQCTKLIQLELPEWLVATVPDLNVAICPY